MKVDGLLLGMRLSLGLAVMFLSNTPAGDAKPPGDCSSIFLGSLSESNAVHIPSTGIYHSLDGTTHNDRPVYQHTAGHAYMYFLQSRRSGQRFWAVGPEVGSEEAEMAISANDLNKPEKAQQNWRLWNNESESWSTVGHLKAVCVDDEFGPCTSGRLRMSGVSNRGGMQKRRMGLYVLTNRTHDLRPVYKHEDQEEFLFYSTAAGGKWIVGPDVGRFSGGMFVSDFALRPEFIVQTWEVFAGRYFMNDAGVKLKCQGIDKPSSESEQQQHQQGKQGNKDQVEEIPEIIGANYGEPHVEGDTGTIQARLVERGFPFENRGRVRVRDEVEDTGCDSTCLHEGHCQRSEPDDYRCICPEHYFGLHCQIDVDCGHPPLVSGQQVVSTTGHYILDVAFYRCPENTILDGPPGVICQIDGTWTDPPKCLDGAATVAVCPETATACGNLTDIHCHSGGICCFRSQTDKFCACLDMFYGDDCSIDLKGILESRQEGMQLIGLSSAISIFVGLIALVALGIITFVIVRSSRKRRYWGLEPVDPEKDLDKTIIFVQEEISKLSTVQQLNKLHRLSKLFEKTVREAILSEPGQRVERPKSVAMNEYLPRWSSAPSCLNRPPNELDMPDGELDDDDVFQKPKLQQVFSLQ